MIFMCYKSAAIPIPEDSGMTAPSIIFHSDTR